MLFEKLAFYYPGKWQQCFKSEAELKNWMIGWAEELEERKVTFDEAKLGLGQCIKLYKDWPPTFPQFLEACRPSLDYEAAFHEAIEQMHLRGEGRDEWSNPAIYHAAVRIGMDMNNPYAYLKTRWKTELDKAIYDVSAGNLPSVIEKRVNPSGYLPAPKRQDGEYSEAYLNEKAKLDEILNSEPAWRKTLHEKGKDISSPHAGL